MIEIPIERCYIDIWSSIYEWLYENFGEPSEETWLVDIQFSSSYLVCTEEIASMFLMRWK
jgi:hypothetical protein